MINIDNVAPSKILQGTQEDSIRARAQASERARASEPASQRASQQAKGHERFASKQEII